MVRSVIPVNVTRSCPECQRADATVSGLSAAPPSATSAEGDVHGGTHGKAEIRVVCPDPDDHLAADAVRTTDATDE